jgi:hypothetical protein
MIVHVHVAWVFVGNAVVTAIFVIVMGWLTLIPHARRPLAGNMFSQIGDGFARTQRVDTDDDTIGIEWSRCALRPEPDAHRVPGRGATRGGDSILKVKDDTVRH